MNSILMKILGNIKKVIRGKDEVIRLILTGFISQGHILINDIPGVGKTVLSKSLARSIKGNFNRIQFTPDLLPADIIGTYVYNQKEVDFIFRPGPVFTNILLCDEINRGTPRTQSSLLEAMEEYQVTVERKTFKLPVPFFVIATQNPLEQAGTYPLPEAELDRFFMSVEIGYPDEDSELRIMNDQIIIHPLESLRPVVDVEEVCFVQNEIKKIFIEPTVKKYILALVNATRFHPNLAIGSSPRGSLYLQRGAQAVAAIHERDYVIPDDLKKIFISILKHRIILTPQAKLTGLTPIKILENILGDTIIPK
ncbi:MoxR family ATPase [Candidatus Dependentiae bacterium]|nr:MoxR family ATPase [Candidatus Dependentiae bacterium]